MSCAERPDNFEKRRERLRELSEEELHARFWELVDRIVDPMIEEARTHTTPSIERSVLLRMGLSSVDANTLRVVAGDGVSINNSETQLEVRINDSMAAGCAGYSSGLPGTLELMPLQQATLCRVEHWQRRVPQVITSDRGGHD